MRKLRLLQPSRPMVKGKHRPKSRAAAGAAVGALVALAAWVPGASSAAVGHAAACTPATNLEAVIDDSGSMGGTDPNRLRVAGLDLLIDTPGNERKTLGAVEFGDAADAVFAPGAIGPNAGGMKAALGAKINADNGTTNYNAAFDQANADNPTAQARIFLTDGGHNADAYLNTHLGGGKPRTYVVGFGSSTSGADGVRLAQIAGDTGGQYFPQTDSSNLQAVINRIGATLNCLSAPKQYTDMFTKVGQSRVHSVPVAGSTKVITLVVSWPNPSDSYTASLTPSSGKAVAAKLRVTRRHGKTFLSAQFKGFKKGKLKVRVKAKRLGLSLGTNRTTTQITQSKR